MGPAAFLLAFLEHSAGAQSLSNKSKEKPIYTHHAETRSFYFLLIDKNKKPLLPTPGPARAFAWAALRTTAQGLRACSKSRREWTRSGLGWAARRKTQP
ncbi:hypothetical protein [Allofranklinella schreckenbergeri]|uniref:hypothetical protein n=1 Tax=Allofranklinella schreckenbergeri TaxID=1076744 RepID=UPI0011C48CB6|nr:hypothetical protein [Allofranklinella schreckenbergeri]